MENSFQNKTKASCFALFSRVFVEKIIECCKKGEAGFEGLAGF